MKARCIFAFIPLLLIWIFSNLVLTCAWPNIATASTLEEFCSVPFAPVGDWTCERLYHAVHIPPRVRVDGDRIVIEGPLDVDEKGQDTFTQMTEALKTEWGCPDGKYSFASRTKAHSRSFWL